jgi:hypothetical protein
MFTEQVIIHSAPSYLPGTLLPIEPTLFFLLQEERKFQRARFLLCLIVLYITRAALFSTVRPCCAMVKAFSHRPLNMEALVHAQVSPCGSYDGQSANGTGFSLSSSVFPCQYHSVMAVHTHMSSGG